MRKNKVSIHPRGKGKQDSKKGDFPEDTHLSKNIGNKKSRQCAGILKNSGVRVYSTISFADNLVPLYDKFTK